MAQAKTLSENEIKVVLKRLATERHAARNRAVVLMSYWSGMRAGELAALRIGDVVNDDGAIKDQVRLKADQTKGNRGRTVLLGDRLRRELSVYVATLRYKDAVRPFFYSQERREGFNGNTMSQLFIKIYRWAGISGASSHSGRRTFITTLANKGVGVRVLMALAGHRNMSTTQRYIDLNEEMMRHAANLISL